MPELVDSTQGGLTHPMPAVVALPEWNGSDVLARRSLTRTLRFRTESYLPQVRISASSPSEPIRKAICRAVDLLALPPGWDSYDADRVTEEAARCAVKLLLLVSSKVPGMVAPSVVPTVRGGLQLEWHRRGVDLEVEFDPAGSCEWYGEERDTGRVEEGRGDDRRDELQQWVTHASA